MTVVGGVLLVAGIVLLNLPYTRHSPLLSLLAGLAAGAGLVVAVVVALVKR
jgi:drug/metabolite transporter (DMT)-like permease